MKFYYKLVIYDSLIFRVRKVPASVDKSSPAGEGTPLKRALLKVGYYVTPYF